MNRTLAPLVLLASLALALLTGCSSLVPFTHELRTTNNLTNDDLKNLQFYVSNRIILRRELDSGSRQVTGTHKLLLLSGHTVEEVVVEARTPGIAVAVTDGSISVSFEPGSFITFAPSGDPAPQAPAGTSFAEAPNPFPGNDGESVRPPKRVGLGGAYWLQADAEWRLTFQGTTFTAKDDSMQAHLMIDAQSLEQVQKNRKVLPGMVLPSR
jgi:hypothetical protein